MQPSLLSIAAGFFDDGLSPGGRLAFIKFDVLWTGITAGQACGEINPPGPQQQHARILHASGSQILRVSKAPIIALNPIDLTYFALSYDGVRIYLAGPPMETIPAFSEDNAQPSLPRRRGHRRRSRTSR